MTDKSIAIGAILRFPQISLLRSAEVIYQQVEYQFVNVRPYDGLEQLIRFDDEDDALFDLLRVLQQTSFFERVKNERRGDYLHMHYKISKNKADMFASFKR